MQSVDEFRAAGASLEAAVKTASVAAYATRWDRPGNSLPDDIIRVCKLAEATAIDAEWLEAVLSTRANRAWELRGLDFASACEAGTAYCHEVLRQFWWIIEERRPLEPVEMPTAPVGNPERWLDAMPLDELARRIAAQRPAAWVAHPGCDTAQRLNLSALLHSWFRSHGILDFPSGQLSVAIRQEVAQAAAARVAASPPAEPSGDPATAIPEEHKSIGISSSQPSVATRQEVAQAAAARVADSPPAEPPADPAARIPQEHKSIRISKTKAAKYYSGYSYSNGSDYFARRPHIIIEGEPNQRKWFFDVRQFPEKVRAEMQDKQA